jgi:hypothetical protein
MINSLIVVTPAKAGVHPANGGTGFRLEFTPQFMGDRNDKNGLPATFYELVIIPPNVFY